MKKILFVIPSFQTGGTNSSLIALLRAFKQYNITIFSISRCGEFKDRFTNVPQITEDRLLSLWYGNYSEFTWWNKLIALTVKLFKRFTIKTGIDWEKKILQRAANKQKFAGFDIVIGYQEGYATEFAALIPAKKHISWIHCNIKYGFHNYSRYNQSYNQSNAIVCVSQSGKDAFDEIYPMYAEKSNVIYNLINTSDIKSASLKLDPMLQQIAPNDFVIVSVGRFDPIKQFDIIPEIASSLKKLIPNFKWFIIGDGNPDVKQRIKENIEKYQVSENVILTGYKLNPYPFFRKADLYVCTSKSEACPMVFLEANSLGTPVVSNDFPSAHELINNRDFICALDMMPTTIARYLKNFLPKLVHIPECISDSYSKLTSILTE